MTTDLSTLWLVGCTASGKKRVASLIAGHDEVELLSLDSMKIYRQLDRGTDKSPDQHFGLTDLVDPETRFSVGDYVDAAVEAVLQSHARGRWPLFVGGTGLYLRALVRGLFETPPIPPGTRDALRRRAADEGNRVLHDELRQHDPESAERIHVNDTKRLLRALEVCQVTGQSMTHWQQQRTVTPLTGRNVLAGLRWPDDLLRQRIRDRVDRMWAGGLRDEVERIWRAGRLGATAAEAIGYREVVTLLRGEIDEAECIDQIARHTWRLSRRQLNWFAQFPEIRWFDAQTESAELAESITAYFRTERGTR